MVVSDMTAERNRSVRKFVPFVGLVLAATYILYNYMASSYCINGRTSDVIHFAETPKNGSSSSTVPLMANFEPYSAITASNSQTYLLVDTPACKLQQTEIFPEYYRENWNWRENKVPICNHQTHFAQFLHQDEVVEVVDYDPEQCKMWEIQRKPHDDCDFLATDRGQFEEKTFNVSAMEMFMVECDGKYNFEATIPRHKVHQKIKYWGQEHAGTRPISFLFLGFDSTSRNHFYRSMPKTMKVMEEMGFQDFKGFHSFDYATLENLEPLLLGLTHKEVRASCQPDWEMVMDDCPFIWNIFDRHNYVTLYLEDGAQTFNWMGCGGFEKQPTDYYIHAMFKALLYYRRDVEDEIFLECASGETLPDFMFRYMERFLEKFMSIPFFEMIYLGSPNHNYQFALPNYDQSVERTMLYLQAHPEIYENTVIIIFGDHGIRYGDFAIHGGPEPWIERALPPLFIRLPERLLKMYPDRNFIENFQINTERLTTARDIHHTMLHILALSNLDPSFNESGPSVSEFEPSQEDRTSLLLPVPDTRTCSLLGIENRFCVCNAVANSPPIENTYFIDKMLEFAVDALNEVVENSRFNETCEEWYLTDEPYISSEALERGDAFTVVLLKFNAGPGDGKFELQLKLFHTENDVLDIEQIRVPHRINRFGNVSSCIEPHNDYDKYMRTVCYCKDEE